MRVFTKYTLIALILLGLSFISMTSSKSGDKTCLDVNGKEVDWFVIFLYPTTSSPSDTLSYGYYDVNSKDIEFYEYDDKTFPGIPLMMSYKDDKSSNYFFWNDDASTETEEKSGGSGKAHSKGGLIFNKNSGFLLSHSLPRFPRRNDKNEIEPSFPSNAGIYGQTFICLSMNYENTLKVVETLNIINPPLLLNVDTDVLNSPGNPEVVKLIKNKQDKNSPDSKITEVQTKKGNSFYIFSKSRNEPTLPWDEQIPKFYKDGFYVETWTKPKLEDNICTGNLKVINVAELKFSNFSYNRNQEHSKWGVAMTKDVCCIGDLNRTDSQKKRGGNVICFTNSKLADIMRKGIVSKDSCGKSKLSFLEEESIE